MGTFHSRSIVIQACSLLLACLLFSLWAVSPARADVGPAPILPDGSSLKPEGETPIEMRAETVILTIRQATEADNTVVNADLHEYFYGSPAWFPAVAEVQAEFRMKNPTSEDVSMTVWFPLASFIKTEEEYSGVVSAIRRFQVMVDGKEVDYSVRDLPHPRGGDRPPLPWANFPVTFPAKERVWIQVSYILPAQRPESHLGALLMEFNYIFQTGAGWAGPIGTAELVVNLPYPASPKTIVLMPEGGKVNGQQVRWIWENLEPSPDDDFRISLMQPERWEALQADQVAVKARPKDGQAWLKLCKTYYGLSYIRWHKIPGFGEVYAPLGLEACQEAAHLLPKSTHSDGLAWLDLCATYYRLNAGETSDPLLAVQACQEAARLLPTDAAPHYGLAVLYLSQLSNNPSPAKLQPVLDELKIGQELEAAQPPSNQVSYFLPLLGLGEDSPSEYITNWVNRISNVPTATAELPIKTATPKATLRVTVRNTLTPQSSPTSAPTVKLTLTPTSIPSETSQPLPTPTAPEFATLVPPASVPRGSMTGIGLGVVAAGVILIGIVVFLVLKRR